MGKKKMSQKEWRTEKLLAVLEKKTLSQKELEAAIELARAGVDPSGGWGEGPMEGRTLLTRVSEEFQPGDGSESPWIKLGQILLDQGADPNDAERMGDSALIMAAENGSLAGVEMLLRAGADPNQISQGGVNALMRAAGSGEKETAERLWEATDKDEEDWNGEGVSDWMLRGGLGEMLLDKMEGGWRPPTMEGYQIELEEGAEVYRLHDVWRDDIVANAMRGGLSSEQWARLLSLRGPWKLPAEKEGEALAEESLSDAMGVAMKSDDLASVVAVCGWVERSLGEAGVGRFLSLVLSRESDHAQTDAGRWVKERARSLEEKWELERSSAEKGAAKKMEARL